MTTYTAEDAEDAFIAELTTEHPFARLSEVLGHLSTDTAALALVSGAPVEAIADSVMINCALIVNAACILHPEWAMALHREMLKLMTREGDEGGSFNWREWAEVLVDNVRFEHLHDPEEELE